MPSYIINSTSGLYTVSDDRSTYLLREGSYISSATHGIYAVGTITDNTYIIDGYILADGNYSAIFLGGEVEGANYRNHINIEADGVLSGGRGISVLRDPVTITNQGSIYSNYQDGIYLSESGSLGHRVVNSGVINAASDVVDIAGSQADIENHGIMTGGSNVLELSGSFNRILNTGSMTSDSTAIFIDDGFNTITNSGLVTSNEAYGIDLDGDDNSVTNTATGIIRAGIGSTDVGVRFSTGVSNTVVNDGAIYSGGTGVIFSSASLTTTGHVLTNRGTISSDLGNAVLMTGESNQITNSGSLVSNTLEAIVFNGSNNLIVNSGDISGEEAGVFIFDADAISNRVENSGSITSLQGQGIFSESDAFSLFNSAQGIITSEGAMAVEIVGTGTRVFNDGVIYSAFSEALNIVSNNAIIKNSGTIETGGTSTTAVFWDNPELTGALTFVNSGEITGNGFAIVMAQDGSNLDLRNKGTITGDIELSDGFHYIRSQDGTIDGAIYLNDGTARLFLGDEDNVVFDSGDSADRFDLGGGIDEVIYQNSLTGVHVDLASGKGFSGTALGDRLIDVENLQGGFGEDLLLGDNGANELDGYFGDDELFGRGGDDYLNGNYDNDDLDGGDGNDILIGSLGGDDLTGGADADVFTYLSASDSAVTGINRDRIMDFEQGVDLIDLSAIGIQDFIFQSAFTGGGTSEVRFQNVGGGTKTLVQIDVDGDGNADMGIIINNAFFNLTEDDFALGA